MKDCGSIMVALEDQKMISNKEVSFLTHLITDLGAEAERIKQLEAKLAKEKAEAEEAAAKLKKE